MFGKTAMLSEQMVYPALSNGGLDGRAVCRNNKGPRDRGKEINYQTATGDGHVKKICIAFLLSALLPFHLYAACVEGDCRNGSGRLESEDGRVYEGWFKDGYLWGDGKLILPDGLTYTGQFVRGKLNGIGTLESPDGRRYEGQFRDGVIDGQGILAADDFEYDGEFSLGRFHGQGTLVYADGRRYEGEFRNNIIEGRGKLDYGDGTGFEGFFRNGRPHGQGVRMYILSLIHISEPTRPY